MAFAPDAAPQSLTTQPGTAYLIVETTSSDSTVSRQIIKAGSTSFVTYTPQADHICLPHTTDLTWR